MKRIFTILAFTISLSICHAQEAVYLVSNPNTARWSYIETDSNGKMTATIFNSVESIAGDAVNGNIKMLVEEVPVASPKDTVRSFVYYRFKDGEFMADMSAMMSADYFASYVEENYPELTEEQMNEVLQELQAMYSSGEIRGIPRYPKTGKLPDFEFQFKLSIINMRVVGEERKIVGTEKIQTGAGSFDCFILEEKITTKFMMMKDVEKIRSWYAYGIGLVKEVTYDKNGKLVSTMTLNEITEKR